MDRPGFSGHYSVSRSREFDPCCRILLLNCADATLPWKGIRTGRIPEAVTLAETVPFWKGIRTGRIPEAVTPAETVPFWKGGRTDPDRRAAAPARAGTVELLLAAEA